MTIIPGRLLVEQLAAQRVQRQEDRAWWLGFAWGWVGATALALVFLKGVQ